MHSKEVNLVLLDFDGTLSAKSGGSVVFGPEYCRVVADPEQGITGDRTAYGLMSKQPYNAGRSDSIAAKMQGEKDTSGTFKLADGAKDFIQALLMQKNVKIHIISKNHQEYIEAMFKHNGLAEELQSIPICDLRQGGGAKDSAVEAIINKYQSEGANIKTVTVCDDDKIDCAKMTKKSKEKTVGQGAGVESFTATAGKFEFEPIKDNVLTRVNQESARAEYK